mgnify:FL=1|jgi:hypothetical protein|tara:strand:+ start:612 stop:1238 length:627 start_codon:yes stop_codon:yes gene_type:complete
MNYTELQANIQDICETTFTSDELALFTQQAEQKIYTAVQFPALRRNQTANMAIGNKYLTLPSDFLWSYSLAIVSSSDYIYLLNKDVNFIRDAYPNPATTGVPKHYAYFTDTSLIIGPTPNAAFDVEFHYGYYPASIVTASTSWLGDDFDSALLNGALVEAIRFMKGEADMIDLYRKMYLESLTLLGGLGDSKLREDAYRSGQYRTAVG